MKKLLFMYSIFQAVCSTAVFASLHVSPATDEGLIELGSQYPSVGVVVLTDETSGTTSHATASLVRIPEELLGEGNDLLKGRLQGSVVLSAKHVFRILEEKKKFRIKISDGSFEERDILEFIPVPSLRTKFCCCFTRTYERDIGFGILSSPITSAPMADLLFDFDSADDAAAIITLVGNGGFHGRADLGLVAQDVDFNKRAIQFNAAELKGGQGPVNPLVSESNLPIFLQKPRMEQPPIDELLRGMPFHGDSGGPVFVKVGGKDTIIAVLHGVEARFMPGDPNNAGYIFMLEIQHDLETQLNKLLEKQLTALQSEGWARSDEDVIEQIESCHRRALSELDESLKGNGVTVSPLLEKFMRRAYLDNIVSIKFESLAGVDEWLGAEFLNEVGPILQDAPGSAALIE